MNQRQQVVSRDAQHDGDLRRAQAGNSAGRLPATDGRARHPEQRAQLGGATGSLDKVGDSHTRHSAHRQIFRRGASSPLVEEISPRCREIRHYRGVNLKAVGKRVRQLRHEAGETQPDLGAAVGMTRQTIAGIENGLAQGGLTTMVAIADHYKVPMDWLLCRSVPPGGPKVGQFVERPEDLRLLDIWAGFSRAEKLDLIHYMMTKAAAPDEAA